MPTTRVFVGSQKRELYLTSKEAKRHGVRNGQAVDVEFASKLTRDRLIEAGAAADKVLRKYAPKDKEAPHVSGTRGAFYMNR